MIKVTDNRGYSLQGLVIHGEKRISIRQMYTTKGDPTWKPGKQGVTLPVDSLVSVIQEARRIIEEDDFREFGGYNKAGE